MSRCFPYPPPGYIPRSTVDGALIESIKLQREYKKSKEERHQRKAKKDKKREKKEKEKKEKKEEKVKSKRVASVPGELNDKKGQTGEVGLVKLKDGPSQRTSKDEAEQLEKSDLTEEYGQPVNSQNSCHSSDSTESSGKRKRDTSVSGDASLSSGNSNHGNIIRLRLPLSKPKESEALVTKEQKGSERLPTAKNCGPEVSLGSVDSSCTRPALLKHKESEASVRKEQSSVSLPHLKGKEPEASSCKEQNSYMRLPLQKQKGSMASVSKQSSSVRLPLQKQKGPVASVGQEQSSSMQLQLPLRSHRETEALAVKEQRSSMRLPHLKRKEPEASPSKEWSASMELSCLKRQKPDASSNKERSSPVSKQKESETSTPPVPKQREPEASRREESCSTSGRVDFIAHQKWVTPGQTIEAQPISPRSDPQLPCSTVKVPEIVLQRDGEIDKGSSSSSSKSSRRQRAKWQYKALVEDWIPPLLQVELTDSCDDQGWLFQKHGERQESKLAQQEAVNCEWSSTSWPRAQYIQAADAYALPFTVPF